MMRDYYDVYPANLLDKPLALTGFYGAGVQRVGTSLSTRTGLPGIDLDRWIEHEAGCSLSEMHLTRPAEEHPRLERLLLKRALQERPAGVIMLGEGTLADEENRRLVLEGATLVYLRAQLPWLLAGIVEELQASPGCLPTFLYGAPGSASELLPYFHKRAPGYEAAHLVIDVDSRATGTVVQELKQRFKI
jgi:XRE family transcriptional regulator, aerobic/anaerobic benzoate catabolism transcriptional regulator